MYLYVGNFGSCVFVIIKYVDKYNIMYVYFLFNGIIIKYVLFWLIVVIRIEYFWDCMKLFY